MGSVHYRVGSLACCSTPQDWRWLDGPAISLQFGVAPRKSSKNSAFQQRSDDAQAGGLHRAEQIDLTGFKMVNIRYSPILEDVWRCAEQVAKIGAARGVGGAGGG